MQQLHGLAPHFPQKAVGSARAMGAPSQPSQHDLLIAFLVTAGAGLSTTLGAMLVFWPRIYSPRALATCLAFAAGVMIYVSFIEIFYKSVDEFSIYFDDKNGVNKSTVSAEDYEEPPEA